MKICWDMLERVHLSRNGTFRKGQGSYIYKEACERCGNPYLTIKSNQSRFCSFSCAESGKNNHMYGKAHTSESIKKISSAVKGKNNGMYGKTHTTETKKKISIANTGRICTIKSRKKLSKINSKRIGRLNPCYRGGVTNLGVTTYETYKNKLDPYEEIRKQKNTEILEVRCAYCNRWYAPTATAVSNRVVAINNLNRGEHRLYCSENCKQACPIYKQVKYPKGFKHTTSREVSPYLRQMVFERDNWTCQICRKTIAECQLHCHHMDPIAQNPMFQNDMDSCITLCKGCHKMVHSRKGCRYVDLQCKRSY